jgi:NAD(P)H-hydrate epimerase
VRHLTNWGFAVEPVMGSILEELTPVARRQAEILRSIGVHDFQDSDDSELSLRRHLDYADLIIDALAGYGLAGPPAGIAAAAAEMAIEAARPVLSLDVPTGINSATGQVNRPSIPAVTTLLLDLPKPGVLAPACSNRVGKLYLADRGVPHVLYEAAGVDMRGVFSEGPIVRLRR